MTTLATAPRRIALAAALLALAASPSRASAQSELDSSQAQDFIGNWVMTLETDFGVMDLDLRIEDMMGKVGAHVGSPDMGGMQEVTDITRDGENLLLAYDVDAQGQLVDVALTLQRDGDNLAATIEAAAGQFVMSTTATPAT